MSLYLVCFIRVCTSLLLIVTSRSVWAGDLLGTKLPSHRSVARAPSPAPKSRSPACWRPSLWRCALDARGGLVRGTRPTGGCVRRRASARWRRSLASSTTRTSSPPPPRPVPVLPLSLYLHQHHYSRSRGLCWSRAPSGVSGRSAWWCSPRSSPASSCWWTSRRAHCSWSRCLRCRSCGACLAARAASGSSAAHRLPDPSIRSHSACYSPKRSKGRSSASSWFVSSLERSCLSDRLVAFRESCGWLSFASRAPAVGWWYRPPLLLARKWCKGTNISA